jgi:hypothetical protein
MGMKFMAALAVFAFSTGLAWSAEEPVKTPRTPSPAQKAQQEKMKTCNAEAKKQGLKSDERKKFMSACLKGATKIIDPSAGQTESSTPSTPTREKKSRPPFPDKG